ncbi:MAG: hypothetical protein ACRDRQ_20100 [Pseudonocardiaceae bacterium]
MTREFKIDAALFLGLALFFGIAIFAPALLAALDWPDKDVSAVRVMAGFVGVIHMGVLNHRWFGRSGR